MFSKFKLSSYQNLLEHFSTIQTNNNSISFIFIISKITCYANKNFKYSKHFLNEKKKKYY